MCPWLSKYLKFCIFNQKEKMKKKTWTNSTIFIIFKFINVQPKFLMDIFPSITVGNKFNILCYHSIVEYNQKLITCMINSKINKLKYIPTYRIYPIWVKIYNQTHIFIMNAIISKKSLKVLKHFLISDLNSVRMEMIFSKNAANIVL